MKQSSYTIVLKAEPEGGYTVVVPSLPGCVTYGETLEEAKDMAADAIKGYLISLEKHGEEIPFEESVFLTNINVNTPPRLSFA